MAENTLAPFCKYCGGKLGDQDIYCPACGKQVRMLKSEADKLKKAKNKKPVYKKWWFWLIVFIFAVNIFGGGDDSPSGSTNSTTRATTQATTQTATKATEPEETVIEISPEDLQQAYSENEVAADEKYDGKMLKITGTIDSIGKDIVDKVYVTLETGEYWEEIQCYFSSKAQIEAVANLKSGDVITIIGRCDGLSIGNVIVKNCEIQ